MQAPLPRRLPLLLGAVLLPCLLHAQQDSLTHAREMQAALAERPEANRRANDRKRVVNGLTGGNQWMYIATGRTDTRPDDWFEAHIAPVFYFGFTDPRGKRRASILTLVPHVLFRMTREESTPIYTPGLTPELNYHFLPNRNAEREGRMSWVFTAQAAHNSTGTSGPFYAPDGDVNRVNGDFSANYLGLRMAGYRFYARELLSQKARYLWWDAQVRYFGGLADGLVYARELWGTYGRIRSTAHVRYVFEVGKLRGNSRTGADNDFGRTEFGADLELGWIWDRDLATFGSTEFERRFSARLQLQYRPIWLNNFSAFAQVYYGHDYYNIRFVDQILSLRVGIAAELGGLQLRSGTSAR